MRLLLGLVLPLMVGAVQGALETAKVYILQKPEIPTPSTIPTLSPEEARLVIAQRLDSTQRYSLNDVSNEALLYINAFGGPQKELFASEGQDERSQLLLVIDNATPEVAARYQKEWAPLTPAFQISSPTSRTPGQQLIYNSIEEESVEIYAECKITRYNVPSNKKCWPGRSKIMQFHAASGEPSDSPIEKITRILAGMKSEAVDVMIILMPESRHHYNLYDMPNMPHRARSTPIEEPMEELQTSPSSGPNPFSQSEAKKNATRRAAYSTCYSKNETCQNETQNCFGHGRCFLRYNNTDSPDDSCYACGCVPSIDITFAADGKTELARRTYWGGAACQKEDVSSPFWLVLGVTVALVGVVSAGVAMLFNIGEEKLPSVIGAGVSGPKAR